MCETIENWIEWKRLCALDLCCPGTQAALRSYMGNRLRNYLIKYAFMVGRQNGWYPEVGEAECWHLFETYMLIETKRAKKCQKDWLFANCDLSSDPPIKVIRGVASQRARDAAREYLRQNFAPSKCESLDAPFVKESGDTRSLIETLVLDPDAGMNSIVRREYEEIAGKLGRRIFDNMSRRDRIAVLARSLDVALYSPVVLEVAGCGKSVLSDGYKKWSQHIIENLKVQYADDGPTCIATLAYLVFAEVDRLCEYWAKTEIACDAIFQIAGGPDR